MTENINKSITPSSTIQVTLPKEKKAGAFQDGTGSTSIMRVLFLSSFIVATVIAFLGIFLGKDTTAYVGLFLGSGFIGKATQSFAERNTVAVPTNTTNSNIVVPVSSNENLGNNQGK